jgi:hypothetical protein
MDIDPLQREVVMVAYDGQDRRQTRTIFVQIPMSQWRMGIAVMSPTVMLLGALLGVKTFEAGPYLVAVGSFVFPWTFATIVLMSEVYGIPSGFRLALFDTMALSLASICFLVASNIPAATPRSPFVVAFNTLYTVDVPTLAVVNVAFAGGLMAAVVLLYVLGTLTTRRLVLSRFWLAPALAQIVTTTIALPILLYLGYVPNGQEAWHLWLSRLSLALILTIPLGGVTYFAAWWIRRHDYPIPAPSRSETFPDAVRNGGAE